jgi:hypothetical protein
MLSDRSVMHLGGNFFSSPSAPVIVVRLLGLALTPGCQIGYMDHTGCREPVYFTIRPTRGL